MKRMISGLAALCALACDGSHAHRTEAHAVDLTSDCCPAETDGGATGRFSFASTEIDCWNGTEVEGNRQSGGEEVFTRVDLDCGCYSSCTYLIALHCGTTQDPQFGGGLGDADIDELMWCYAKGLESDVECRHPGSSGVECHAQLTRVGR